MVSGFFSKIFTTRVLVFFSLTLGAFAGLIMVFDQLIMPWYTKHGEALAVPNVVATRFETAKELLELQGLKVVKQGEKYDSQLPFGYVVDQNPRADRLVKRGRRIYLTISVGEREIQAPTLVGLSETNAEETLKSLGLKIGEREYKYDPNELPTVVIEQSVSPGTFMKASTTIDITVSLGEPVANVVVPSVLGKTLDTAKRDIQKAGLTFGRIRYQLNESLLPNTVIQQSLDAGLTVSNGDTLDLVVSRLGTDE